MERQQAKNEHERQHRTLGRVQARRLYKFLYKFLYNFLCDKKCKKSVFLSLYKFCYNSVHFCICQNLINSSVEIIKISSVNLPSRATVYLLPVGEVRWATQIYMPRLGWARRRRHAGCGGARVGLPTLWVFLRLRPFRCSSKVWRDNI